MPYFTYILKCSDGSYYVGKTTNIFHRLRAHNGEIKGGAKYTASKRPVRLVYSEEFALHKDSAQREYFLKQLSHQQKNSLVNKKLQKKLDISFIKKVP